MPKDKWTKPAIIFIDDAPVHARTLSEQMERRGISASFQRIVPDDWTQQFGGATLPKALAWDEIDCAFVDLDLSGEGPDHSIAAGGLAGGTVFLPEIRKRAPWLPVISCSGYYSCEGNSPSNEPFVLEAGLFPFDAILPRGMGKKLDHEAWLQFFRRAECNALVRTLGEDYRMSGKMEAVEVRAVNDIFSGAGIDPESARKVLSRTFYTAQWLSLETVAPGYSGAATYRAIVGDRSERGSRESEWLVKLSASPSTLQKELNAHHRLQRSGMSLLRSVPTLWHTVVCADRIAGIAYQFASGTNDGATFLQTHLLDEFVKRVQRLLNEFFSGATGRIEPYASALSEVMPTGDEYRDAVASLHPGASQERLRALAGGKAYEIGAQSVRYSRTLLHGDMNVRNFMFGERDVMIDFANSSVGPLASDLAGLCASVLLQHEPAREGFRFHIGLSSCDSPWISHIVEPFLTEPDDRMIFSELLAAYLVGALRWSAIPSETKLWVRETMAQADKTAA
jgi:Phosphotransferase enzyme family